GEKSKNESARHAECEVDDGADERLSERSEGHTEKKTAAGFFESGGESTRHVLVERCMAFDPRIELGPIDQKYVGRIKEDHERHDRARGRSGNAAHQLHRLGAVFLDEVDNLLR